MSIDGWYYLHVNGDLIYKRELGDTVADIRGSDLAKGLWQFDPNDRELVWDIVVEGLASGATPKRVAELAEHWGCNDEDATIYAKHRNISLQMDGNMWCATRLDFINLMESPAGFGPTCYEAIAALAKDLGYQPSKMWGAKLKDLTTG